MRKIIFIIIIASNVWWNFQITSILFFISNFNLYYIASFYVEQNKIVEQAVRTKTFATLANPYNDIHNTFTDPCEKPKMAPITSLKMKKN